VCYFALNDKAMIRINDKQARNWKETTAVYVTTVFLS